MRPQTARAGPRPPRAPVRLPSAQCHGIRHPCGSHERAGKLSQSDDAGFPPASPAPVAQWIERSPPEREAAGSNPAGRAPEVPAIDRFLVDVCKWSFAHRRCWWAKLWAKVPPEKHRSPLFRRIGARISSRVTHAQRLLARSVLPPVLGFCARGCECLRKTPVVSNETSARRQREVTEFERASAHPCARDARRLGDRPRGGALRCGARPEPANSRTRLPAFWSVRASSTSTAIPTLTRASRSSR